MAGRVVSSGLTGLLLVALAACNGDPGFECFSHDACQSGDGAGFCESDGNCSVVDQSCPSGRRYASNAGGLAGQCVPETEVPTSGDDGPPPPLPDTGGSSSSDGGEGSTTSSVDDSPGETSTGVADGDDTSTTTPSDTGDGSESSAGDGNPDICQQPLEPAKCLGCVQNNCCMALMSCSENPACVDFLECWTEGSGDCAAYDGECCAVGSAPGGVGICMQSQCSATCPY